MRAVPAMEIQPALSITQCTGSGMLASLEGTPDRRDVGSVTLPFEEGMSDSGGTGPSRPSHRPSARAFWASSVVR